MFVPLNGTSAGQTVSYAVTASNYADLTPVLMPQSNKSLRLNVLINGVSEPMTFQLFDNLAPVTASAIESWVSPGFITAWRFIAVKQTG